jgi:acyl-CoA dehydrogenase
MFAEAIEQILQDQCTPAVVRAIQAGGSPQPLWDAITSAGFLELMAAEADGGAGLPLAELFPIFALCGTYAVPLPLAQSIAARALLPHAVIPAGMLTFASGLRREADGTLVCPLTSFGMVADHVVADDAGSLILLPADQAERTATGVRGNLSATMAWRADVAALRVENTGAGVAAFGAALHAALLSGAMNKVFALTLQYGNDRVQFGKSIGKFQAIQHQLSVMAEHVAAGAIAAEAAFQGEDRQPVLLAGAIAKSRTSEAAQLIASIAHAVHGAIGITEEYDLQLYTRCLHEWRIAHGSEAYWNLVVGRSLLASAAPTITDFVRSVHA